MYFINSLWESILLKQLAAVFYRERMLNYLRHDGNFKCISETSTYKLVNIFTF